MRTFLLVGPVITLLAVSWSLGATIFVKADAPLPGDGLTWGTAFPRLQDALAASVPGDSLWVAAGTYHPDEGALVTPGDRLASFTLRNGVAILGGFAGDEDPAMFDPELRDWRAHRSVLSGDLLGNDGPNFRNYEENSVHVLVAPEGTDETAVLDGFIVTSGNANLTTVFSDGGGGISIVGGSPVIRRCIFTRNRAVTHGGAMLSHEGAPVVDACLFVGNLSLYNGGAIYTGFSGGSLTNCVISGNRAYEGGAVASFSAYPQIVHCTIAYNEAFSGGGIQYLQCDLDPCNAPTIRNSILWGNRDLFPAADSDQIVRSHCNVCLDQQAVFAGVCVEGGLTGVSGVIEDAPLFADADGPDNVFGTEDDDLRLRPGSPCRDIGVDAGVLTDVDGRPRGAGGGVDLGAYEGDRPRILLSAESVSMAEGGSSSFTVHLSEAPSGPVEVEIAGGSSDLTASPLQELTFDADTFDVPRTVILMASDDDDFLPDRANFGLAAPGYLPAGASVEALDDSPFPPIVLVNDDAPPPGDGLSWETAYSDLQDALDYARTYRGYVREIWVAEGTYRPDRGAGHRHAWFELIDGVRMYGGFAGHESLLTQRDPALHRTILNGDLLGDDGPDFTNMAENTHHVMHSFGVGSSTVLDGFTLRSGWADGARPHANGSALRIEGGAPVVRNCRFELNRSIEDGALSAWYSSPVIEDCVFEGNGDGHGRGGAIGGQMSELSVARSAFVANVATSGSGIKVFRSVLRVTDCVFDGNSTDYGNGGAIESQFTDTTVRDTIFTSNTTSTIGHFNGGAIHHAYGTLLISGCDFIHNEAKGDGGAVYVGSGRAVVQSCRFHGNSVFKFGAAVSLDSSTLVQAEFVNCVFSGNAAWLPHGTGGAISCRSSAPLKLVNCTLNHNYAAYTAGAIFLVSGCDLVMENTILWDNYGTDVVASHVHSSIILADHSCIEEPQLLTAVGIGNISTNPMFVDANGADNLYGSADDDLHLLSDSPCINAGDASLLPADALDLDRDRDTSEPIPLDLDGQPRVQGECLVDIGAYERSSDAGVFGDFDGDCVIDMNDFRWFSYCFRASQPGQPARATCFDVFDSDGDDDLDLRDFAAVQRSFTP